jgi:hypothetical protein
LPLSAPVRRGIAGFGVPIPEVREILPTVGSLRLPGEINVIAQF